MWVSQENIDSGSRGDSRRCPVSLALVDAGFVGARVFQLGIEFSANPTGLCYFTNHIRSIVKRYDIMGCMDPFSFDIVSDDERCYAELHEEVSNGSEFLY